MNLLPSWCNLRGGIDRSACIELRVSELRRLARCVVIDHKRRDRRGRLRRYTNPLKDEIDALRRFQDGSRRLTSGSFTVDVHDLLYLHSKRKPRMLAGDFRTARAHVMRSQHDLQRISKSASRRIHYRTRITRASNIAWPVDRSLPGNPNKGATRTKIIGMYPNWSQPIRIEKWRYPKRIHDVYFMICPGHANAKAFAHSSEDRTRKAGGNNRSSSLPPLSTRRPGRECPSSKKCPQRCLKLMMVQCLEREVRDAELAQLWIASLPQRLHCREPYYTFIHRLHRRYGPIFQPRVLLCPRCVGVHYGNHPETIRQGWRRRNNKPDTSIASNTHLLPALTPMDHWAKIAWNFMQMDMKE